MATNFARTTQGKKNPNQTEIFVSKLLATNLFFIHLINFTRTPQELSPHDIQRFAFTGVGRHPDSMNAILE